VFGEAANIIEYVYQNGKLAKQFQTEFHLKVKESIK
jgi:hypothetical protein